MRATTLHTPVQEGPIIFVEVIATWFKMMNVKKNCSWNYNDYYRHFWKTDCASFDKQKVCRIVETCKSISATQAKALFRLSIRTVDVTVKHYFPPSPPLRLLYFLLSSARPSAKSVKGSRGLIWLVAISHTHNSMVTFLLFYLKDFSLNHLIKIKVYFFKPFNCMIIHSYRK